MSEEDDLIDRITEDRLPHYELFSWHYWPRVAGEPGVPGGEPDGAGDNESWHREWLRIAERTWERAGEEEAAQYIRNGDVAGSARRIAG